MHGRRTALREAVSSRLADSVETGCHRTHSITWKRKIMLYTIAVVLVILWLLGLVTSYTIGGFIHILLVVAVIMILLRLINGRGV
jgi:hypothetical protein